MRIIVYFPAAWSVVQCWGWAVRRGYDPEMDLCREVLPAGRGLRWYLTWRK